LNSKYVQNIALPRIPLHLTSIDANPRPFGLVSDDSFGEYVLCIKDEAGR
jgi:hypothetical protein